MKLVVPFLMFLTLLGCSSTSTETQGRIKKSYNQDKYIMVCKTYGATRDCKPVERDAVRRDLQRIFPRVG